MTAAESSARCAPPCRPKHADGDLPLSVPGCPVQSHRLPSLIHHYGFLTSEDDIKSEQEAVLLVGRRRDESPACFTAGCRLVSQFMSLRAEMKDVSGRQL